MTVTFEDIKAAAEVIRPVTIETPTVRSPLLSEATGAEVVLKLENLQHTGSFKPRGAYNKLASLTDDEKKRGVIAASAGNHAQGVAYHARNLGIPSTIVMPELTPFTKVSRTAAHGASIVLHGADLADSTDKAMEIQAEKGMTFIHPFDDEKIIAGQGTVAIEMLAVEPDLDTLIIPIGGGGLMAGNCISAKSLKPDIRIFGVEADMYPSMYQVLNGLPPTSGGQSIAEGIAVKRPGELTRPVIATSVEEILLVSEANLERGVQVMLEQGRVLAEGAGAAGLAAMLAYPERFTGHRVGVVVCGGNIDSRLVGSILMRGLVWAGRLVRVRVNIQDQPGVLARVSQLVGDTGGNIIEVYHQRLFYDVPVKQAELDLVIETRGTDHVNEIVGALTAAGFPTRMLSATNVGDA